MPPISITAYAPAIVLRIFFNMISVVVGVSVVAAGISVSLVVIRIINNNPNEGNIATDKTVLVQSVSSLAFNRLILSYETGYYYNATDTLYTMVEELNEQLKENFPNSFFKIVISAFSEKPILQLIQKRRRRFQRRAGHRNKASNGQINTIQHTAWYSESSSWRTSSNGEYSSTSPPNTVTANIDWSASPISTNGLVETSSPASSTDTFSTTSTDKFPTISYSHDNSSTSIFSTLSSLFSSLTSTISTPFSTTILQSNNSNTCNIPMNNTNDQPSIIYLNLTIYFNITINESITSNMITNALQSFYPTIIIIDKCRNPNAENGSFNVTLSKILPPSPANINESDLDKQDAIPQTVLDDVNSVIIPNDIFATSTITSSVTTTTTIMVINSTTAITTASTSANVAG